MSIIGQMLNGVPIAADTIIGERRMVFPDGSLFVGQLRGDGSEAVVTDTRPDAVKLAVPVP